MPKQEGTKEKIVEAAIDLIARYGYRGASMRKIAAAVGIRESAIYNHFKNKEEILQAILSQIFTTPFNFDDAEEKAKRGKAFLREYVVAYKLVSFDKRMEKLFRVMMVELFQNPSLRESFMTEFLQKEIQRVSKAFFVMMQDGMVRSDDPIFMAREFLTPLFHYRMEVSLMRIDGRPTTQLSTLFEKHVDFFWNAVAMA